MVFEVQKSPRPNAYIVSLIFSHPHSFLGPIFIPQPTANMLSHPKTTLWLWPTGLFPRRIIFYLRAKHITASILLAHNIHLIPITLDPQTYTLASLPSFEARPEGASLPVMRVEHDEGTYWVRESMAMMEYFEEVFGDEEGYGDLRGHTIKQRSRTRDVLSLLGDAIVWSNVALIHADPITISWSGLTATQMSADAAAHAQGKFRASLGKLEEWVSESGVEEGGSLSGEGARVTLADVCVVVHVEYFREMYGVEWLEGFEGLVGWCAGKKGEEWVVGREALEAVEAGGKWSGVLED
jgi:glutathione S-transferase